MQNNSYFVIACQFFMSLILLGPGFILPKNYRFLLEGRDDENMSMRVFFWFEAYNWNSESGNNRWAAKLSVIQSGLTIFVLHFDFSIFCIFDADKFSAIIWVTNVGEKWELTLPPFLCTMFIKWNAEISPVRPLKNKTLPLKISVLLSRLWLLSFSFLRSQ